MPVSTDKVELDAKIRVVHGRELVAELGRDGFDAFAATFARWIAARTST